MANTGSSAAAAASVLMRRRSPKRSSYGTRGGGVKNISMRSANEAEARQAIALGIHKSDRAGKIAQSLIARSDEHAAQALEANEMRVCKPGQYEIQADSITLLATQTSPIPETVIGYWTQAEIIEILKRQLKKPSGNRPPAREIRARIEFFCRLGSVVRVGFTYQQACDLGLL